jgi:hypothetical protein
VTSFSHTLCNNITHLIVLNHPKPTKLAVEGVLDIEGCAASTLQRQIQQGPAITNVDSIGL